MAEPCVSADCGGGLAEKEAFRRCHKIPNVMDNKLARRYVVGCGKAGESAALAMATTGLYAREAMEAGHGGYPWRVRRLSPGGASALRNS